MTREPPHFTIENGTGRRTIGPGNSTFIIAEMSGNHNQSFERATSLVDAAAAAGVDAIKLQTYTPDTLTIDCDNKYFQVGVNEAWAGKTLYQLYGEAFTPWDWQPKLKEYAESKGLVFFSTPFDVTAVDFLETMEMPLYKVASFETGDLPLLRRIGATQKPVIISRGLTSAEDLQLALQTLSESGCPQVAVLHCVSSYPASAAQMNLSTIAEIAERFGVVAGLSDHTLGLVVPIAAVSLGASIIEKHFTLARADGGPDAAFSLEPQELAEMVAAVRQAEMAAGEPTFEIGEKESENIVFRKSIFVVEAMKQGEPFTTEKIRIIRPGFGLTPKHYDSVIGQAATQDIERGTPLSWELIAK
jgi:pseudaminic acid synthase